MKVRFHVGIMSIILVVILFLSTSVLYYVYKESSIAAQKTSSDMFMVSSQRVVDHVDALFKQANQVANSFSMLPVMGQTIYAPENLHPGVPLILEELKQYNWIYSIYVGHKSGEFFQAISVNENQSIIEKHNAPETTAYIVKQIHLQTDGIKKETRFFMNKKLSLISTQINMKTDFDPRKRPWYQKAISQNNVVMTEPYLFGSLKEFGISSAKKMETGGSVIGVDFSFAGLKDFLKSQKISKNGKVILFDQKKRMIAYSGFKDNELGQAEETLSSTSIPILERVSHVHKNLEIGKPHFLNIDDQLTLFLIDKISGKMGGNIFVAVVGPFSDFTSHIDRMQKSILIITVIVLMIVFPITYWIIRKLASSLLLLENEAKQIQNLDFSKKGGVRSRISEVNQLGNAFSLMKTTIQQRTQALEETLVSLREHENHLEEMVDRRTYELNDALEIINSSIQYSSRIQRSILPDDELFTFVFKDHFIHWEPRDVVGGDVYWCSIWGYGTLVVVGDCTGHGVPGAFMTMITTGAFERAQTEVEPGDIAGLITRMHQLVQLTLAQHDTEGEIDGESDDGMELGVCYISYEDNKLYFSGARFELFEIHENDLRIIKGTKKGIGYRSIDFKQTYETHEIDIKENQSFYMTSDGLIDQIGGVKKRSFGKRRFGNLLLSLQGRPLKEQEDEIVSAFREFQGEEKRRDDVCFMGFKLKEK